MGAAVSRPARSKTSRLLILGMQYSGKSTLLHYLKTNSFQIQNPTINFATGKVGNCNVVDVGGSPEMIQSWSTHYNEARMCLFVVDGTADMDPVRDLIADVLAHTDMQDKRCAVVVTKIDRPGVSRKLEYYREVLNLDAERVQRIFMFCGLDGLGSGDIIAWLNE